MTLRRALCGWLWPHDWWLLPAGINAVACDHCGREERCFDTTVAPHYVARWNWRRLFSRSR